MEQQKYSLVCFNCEEPIKETWKICPACEISLHSPNCPRCKLSVKENWKRCPECEAHLFCYGCGDRMIADEKLCSHCRNNDVNGKPIHNMIIEPFLQMEFLWVPSGQFQMGDIFDAGMENEKPVHTVQISGFYMGKYPVTQIQWTTIMGNNPSRFKGANHPVEQVTWTDVQFFINELNKKNNNNYEFSLPSEAQWEYTARSGGKREKFSGKDSLSDVGWFDQNSNDSSQAVGQKLPNGLGLFDMSGNVWEWCSDTFFNNAYEFHQKKDPVVMNTSDDRVIRGGSWNLDEWSSRCARRFGYPIDFHGPALGFRLAMSPVLLKREGQRLL